MRQAAIITLIIILSLILVTSSLAAVSTAGQNVIDPPPQENNVPGVVEWIDWGDLLYEHPSFIFYTARQDLDTNPCVQAPETVIYGRVPNGGGQGQHQQLLSGCDVPQATWFVVDSSHIYYIRKELNEHVLVRREIDGQPPDKVLDSGVESKALAIDNDYVYYAKSSGETSQSFGIWRIEKDGPLTPQKLIDVFDITGGSINRLHLNNNHLYWTEGDITNSAVKAALKIGGPWSGIAMAGVEGAQDIKTDADYVYWSELGGRIMRHPKAGGPAELLHTAEFPVYHFDVGEGLLAFTQGTGPDGSIWRMDKNGGPAVPIASAQGSPGPIAINSGYIYWNASALKRIIADADPIKMDYVIDWVEVTQAIQDGANSVQLVAQRATYVRVYAHEAQGSSPALVRAALTVKGPTGVPFAGSPLYSGYVDVPAEQPDRDESKEIFLFTLPENWIHAGDITLELEINPLVNGDQAFETNKSNNQYFHGKVNFVNRGMCIITYPVAVETIFGGVQIAAENTPVYFAGYDRAESMLPATLGPVSTAVELWKADGSAFNLEVKNDREELKATMGLLTGMGDDPFFCGEQFTAVQGLVHPNSLLPDNPEGGQSSGQGWSNPPVNWILMEEAATLEEGVNSPKAGHRTAHELAHVTGNGHIGCNVTAQDNSYPYPVDQLDSAGGFNDHWGFDAFTNTGLDPLTTKDFRTYCGPRWVSDYTWNNMGNFTLLAQQENIPLTTLVDDLALAINVSATTVHTGPPGTYLSTGWVMDTADLGDEGLRQLGRSEDLRGEETELGIVLRDGRGLVLDVVPIIRDEPHEEEEDPEPGLPGVVIYSDLNFIPYDPGTRLIQLVDRRTDEILDKIAVSDNAPQVTDVVAKLAADGETVKISWEGRDRDGDDLQYLVRFVSSGKYGTRTVLGPATNALSINAVSINALAAVDGNTGYFEVIATDGVLTGKGISRTFTIPEREPAAVITAPSAAKTISEADVLIAGGRGFDADDGPLSDRSLTWLLDGEMVGNGRFLHLSGLESGAHTLKLRVIDNDGKRAEDSVRINVTALPGPQPPGTGTAVMLPVILSKP